MTTSAQAERGQLTEPDSHVDTELTLDIARERGWEGDDSDWHEAAEYLGEQNLQHFHPEDF